MLSFTRRNNETIAMCGYGQYVLPIIQRQDPESGQSLTEVISASGIRGLFRTAVDVNYVPREVRNQDGTVVTEYRPTATVYEHVVALIEKLARDGFGGELVRISRIRDSAEASRELMTIMNKVLGLLYKQKWDWDSRTGYEAYANSFQAVVMDSQLPQVPGKFLAEMETDRRLQAAKALIRQGKLSSPCTTGTGDPGRSYYLAATRGYSVTELANPLVHELPEKRRGVVNALKNCVEILGEEPSPVHLRDVERTPPLTNAVVACLPFAADDSVIISQSLADKLTARVRKSNWHNIDGVINFRGGLRLTGRNGALLKRAAEWPLYLQRVETLDGHVEFTPRNQGLNSQCQPVNCRDAELLKTLRTEYEAKWQGLVQRLGAYSVEESKCWKKWLSKQVRWTQRNSSHTVYTRYSFGVERIVHNGTVMYREDHGYSHIKPEVGMKLQSDGDLFKGVVSKILPDEKMPLVRLAGKLIRAEVVCEMGRSTAKHDSLRFAHGQMALYALAQQVGGLGLVGEPSVEQIADLAVECGVYEDDSLTCEVFDSTGKVNYGWFPAGVVRVRRHRQDPSVVSAVKGHSADRPWLEQNSVRSGGCVNGIADTACLIAAGLTECARELRSSIPSSVALNLEILRKAVS